MVTTAVHSPRVCNALGMHSKGPRSAAGAKRAARQASAGTPAAGLTACHARGAGQAGGAEFARRPAEPLLPAHRAGAAANGHALPGRALALVPAHRGGHAQPGGAGARCGPGPPAPRPCHAGPRAAALTLSCQQFEDNGGAPKPRLHNAGPALLCPCPLSQRTENRAAHCLASLADLSRWSQQLRLMAALSACIHRNRYSGYADLWNDVL